MPRYNLNHELNQRLVNQLLYYAKRSPQMGQQQSLPYLLLRTLNPNTQNSGSSYKSGINSNFQQGSNSNRMKQNLNSNRACNSPTNSKQRTSNNPNNIKDSVTPRGTPAKTVTSNIQPIGNANLAKPFACSSMSASNAFLCGKADTWNNSSCYAWESINCVGEHIKWNCATPDKIYLTAGKRYLVSFAMNLFPEQLSIGADFATIYLQLNNSDLFAFHGYGSNGCNPRTSISTICGTYLVATTFGARCELSLRLQATTNYCVDCAHINIVEL